MSTTVSRLPTATTAFWIVKSLFGNHGDMDSLMDLSFVDKDAVIEGIREQSPSDVINPGNGRFLWLAMDLLATKRDAWRVPHAIFNANLGIWRSGSCASPNASLHPHCDCSPDSIRPSRGSEKG